MILGSRDYDFGTVLIMSLQRSSINVISGYRDGRILGCTEVEPILIILHDNSKVKTIDLEVKLEPESYTVQVQALDKAGNLRCNK